jgi:predicted nuclease of restriction endonuclease-like (RecB) superfamily
MLHSLAKVLIINFGVTLPQSQSNLAKELLKDSYKFNFLGLEKEYKEKDPENAFVQHMTKPIGVAEYQHIFSACYIKKGEWK